MSTTTFPSDCTARDRAVRPPLLPPGTVTNAYPPLPNDGSTWPSAVYRTRAAEVLTCPGGAAAPPTSVLPSGCANTASAPGNQPTPAKAVFTL